MLAGGQRQAQGRRYPLDRMKVPWPRISPSRYLLCNSPVPKMGWPGVNDWTRASHNESLPPCILQSSNVNASDRRALRELKVALLIAKPLTIRPCVPELVAGSSMSRKILLNSSALSSVSTL
jgi:hypothetical protein